MVFILPNPSFHYPTSPQPANDHLNLLVKRCDGKTLSDLSYFSQLSTEKGQNFSLKQSIHLPVFEMYYTHYVTVHGPHNGILCLECDANIICLWNPSTREFKVLPQSSIQRPPSAADTSFCGLGFGYDSQTDDYKVVRFIDNTFEYHCDGNSYYLETTYQVDLYSLKGNSWKEISDPIIDRGVGVSIESVPGVERPLGFWKNGELFLESSDNELVLFDPSTREFKNLGIHSYKETQMVAYVESLVSINGRSEHVIRRTAEDEVG
ncbi:hypothetical protein V6N11_047548 [Hibiscus sabdariffa]|uniref:F-box associated beta-propeller type 3 domain-containing protein n=1 Tax=Hibiscus sabdariffa TaxID=183260 RepID=A0ABR2NKX6_9ROSI